MTAIEFNNKYKDYLEEGHYGLDIHYPEVIEHLDKRFQEFIKVPKFSYSQIKLKFGRARFYAHPNEIPAHEVEEEINRFIQKNLK